MPTRSYTAHFAAFIFGLLMASAGCAETTAIQNHNVQILFMEHPCSQAIANIDTPEPGMQGLGEMAMAFGFLMGVEATNPGIRGDHETILMRLRDDCARDGSKPALEMLLGYAAN